MKAPRRLLHDDPGLARLVSSTRLACTCIPSISIDIWGTPKSRTKVTRRSDALAEERRISGGSWRCRRATSFWSCSVSIDRAACAHRTYLNVQSHVPDFECGSLSDIDAHKLGRVLVQNVYVAEPIQQELLADGARHGREEGHGGGFGREAPIHWLQAGRTPTPVVKEDPYVV